MHCIKNHKHLSASPRKKNFIISTTNNLNENMNNSFNMESNTNVNVDNLLVQEIGSGQIIAIFCKIFIF